jgi:energy-converting hydrogenase Eha subunit B
MTATIVVRGGRRTSKARIALICIQLVVAGAAVQGGLMLLRASPDLSGSWLDHTPFTSWTLPGIALLVFVAGGEFLTALAVFFRARFARPLAIFSGLGLIAWVFLQLVWMRIVHPVMHPTIFVVGVVISLLALRVPTNAASTARLPDH